MNVAIAGAHGQIALRLTRLLVADGNTVIGLIRNPDHSTDVRQAGAAPVVCDLERSRVEELAQAIAGADAVVFAAGAGPGSGAERKLTMDRDGAIKLLEATIVAGVRRYVMISGAGVEDPPTGDEVFEIYLRAKAEADAAVKASDRNWTILRRRSQRRPRHRERPHRHRSRFVGRSRGTMWRPSSPGSWRSRRATAASSTSAPVGSRSTTPCARP